MIAVSAAALVGAMTAAPLPVSGGGTIAVDNQSSKTIKVAAPGGQATVEPGAGPVAIDFAADAEVGIEVKAWWISEPRQLCLIFTPWGRTVIVTGDRFIRCRSH